MVPRKGKFLGVDEMDGRVRFCIGPLEAVSQLLSRDRCLIGTDVAHSRLVAVLVVEINARRADTLICNEDAAIRRGLLKLCDAGRALRLGHGARQKLQFPTILFKESLQVGNRVDKIDGNDDLHLRMGIQRLKCERLEQIDFGRFDDLQSTRNVGHCGGCIRALLDRARRSIPRSRRLEQGNAPL